MPYTAKKVPYSEPTTSRKAAEQLADRSEVLWKVYRYIKAQGANGATCEEVEYGLAMLHQTASARIRELVEKGRLVNSWGRRENVTKRTAIVWVAR